MPAYPNMAGLLSAAEALMQAAPTHLKLTGGDAPAQPFSSAVSLVNSATTNGTDPTVGAVPGGITRDMLPTPLRWQINEDVDDDPDPQPSPVDLQPPVPEDAGEWVEYEDEDGDKYYHNVETGVTAWTLPLGARVSQAPAATDGPDLEGSIGEPEPDETRPGLWQNIAADFHLPAGSAPQQSPQVATDTGTQSSACTTAAPSSSEPLKQSSPITQPMQMPGPTLPVSSPIAAESPVTTDPVSTGVNESSPEAAQEIPTMVKEDSPAPEPQSSVEWIMYETEEGAPYYHNENTGETRWDLPPGATSRPADAEEESIEDDDGVPDESEAQRNAGAAETTVPSASSQYAQSAGAARSHATEQVYTQGPKLQWGQKAAAQQQRSQQATQQQWSQQAASQQPFSQQATSQQQWSQQAASQQQWFAQQAAAAQAQQQQQQTEWAQYYQQYWSWYQKEQEARQKQGAPEVSEDLAPPPPDASVSEQLAYAMKTQVFKEMEAMVEAGTPAAERKKAMKALQIKWHPDKNPDQREIAKAVFQMLGDKKEWFLHDADAVPDLDIEVDAVD